MTARQKIVLGTPPAAVDGDPVRTASTKANANVDVLNAQLPLTSFATTLTAGQALTAATHLGKRVNINVATAQTFQLPSAASCGADGVILLRNLGTVPVTLAITTGSGDTLGMTTLNGVESALFDTDGVHAWNVLVRGRGTTANETVNGNSTVVGNETVGGTLAVAGVATLGGIVAPGNTNGANAAAGMIGEAIPGTGTGNIANGTTTSVGAITLTPGDWDVTGCAVLTTSLANVIASAIVGLSTTINAFGAAGTYTATGGTPSNQIALPTPTQRMKVTVNTNVYVTINAAFGTAATCSVNTTVTARRAPH